MKQIIILIGMISLFAPPIFALETDTLPRPSKKTSILKLGLTHNKSIQGKDERKYTNHFSINLLSGKSRNEYGFTFSTVASIVRHNAIGLQIAGVYSRIDNQGRGLSIAGATGMFNKYDGVAIAGTLNAISKMNGLQISLINGASKIDGVQLGFFNGARHVNGMQIGLVTIVDSLQGVQLGLVNERKTPGGIQVGVLNISPSGDYPIGLINIMREGGTLKMGAQVDDRTSTILTFRSGGRVTYGILGLGYNIRSKNSLMVFELGFGAHWHTKHPRYRTDFEVAAGWMIKPYTNVGYRRSSGEVVNEGTANYHSIFHAKFRVLPTYKLSNSLELFTGPSLTYLQTHDQTNAHLFPKRSVWKQHSAHKIELLYLGYIAGVNYCF